MLCISGIPTSIYIYLVDVFCLCMLNCCVLQDFDPNSAFFTKAVNKKKKASSDSTQSSKKDRGHERNGAHNGEEEVSV